MSFLIPNAGNTTGGNKFTALDQAEPDSVDFSILGNSGRTGVLSGAAVTANNNSTDVSVAAGTVVLGGVPYSINANTSLGIPTPPADYRFDLVVVRVTNGTPALMVVQGTNSATNPTFPLSRDLITGNFNAATNVDFDTDVVLAAVFRSGGAAVNNADIIDKRAQLSSSVFWQGSTTPAPGDGAKGNLFLEDPVTSGDVNSGLYVKTSEGWQELVRMPTVGGPFWPIGMVGIWPGKGALPQGFREAVGEVLDIATYPDLFAAYGTDYGGDGTTTFGTPDYQDLFIRGAGAPSEAGSTVGQDSITLTSANMPAHEHNMEHTHSIAHTHSNNHTHGPHNTTASGTHRHSNDLLVTSAANTAVGGTHQHTNVTVTVPQHITDAGGSHTHGNGSLFARDSGFRSVVTREPSYGSSNYSTGYYTTGDGWVVVGENVNTRFGGGMAVSAQSGLSITGAIDVVAGHQHNVSSFSASGFAGTNDSGHYHAMPPLTVTGVTDYDYGHLHSITVGPFTGSTGAASSSTSGAASASNTSSVGSGSAHTNIPASKKARYVFRAL